MMRMNRTKSVSLIIMALVIFCYSNINRAATMVFESGFESGTLNGFLPHVTKGGTFTVTTTPTASGNYAGRFNLDYAPGGDNYRAEGTIQGGMNFNFDTEYWFSFQYYYQNWEKDSLAEIAPLQIHNRYKQWGSPCQFGQAVSTAPFVMLSENDEVRFYTFAGTNKTNIAWRAPIKKNVWNTITVHFKISWTSAGYIEAWDGDGVKLFRKDGVNSYRIDNCQNELNPPNFNWGIYKFDWKYKVGTATKRTLIVDNLKIATGSDGYSLVSSASPPPSDTTPPVISNISAFASESNAVITFTTDELSDTRIEYGATTAYGSNYSSASLVTSHSAAITGLTPATTYHYRIKTKDAANNERVSEDRTFTTTSNEALVILNVATSNIASTSATVTWNTNVTANSYLECGTTINYGINTSDSAYVTSHSLTITGLSAKTHYYCRVRSVTPSATTVYSPLFTLDTKTTSRLESDSFSLWEFVYAS